MNDNVRDIEVVREIRDQIKPAPCPDALLC